MPIVLVDVAKGSSADDHQVIMSFSRRREAEVRPHVESAEQAIGRRSCQATGENEIRFGHDLPL